MQHQGDPPVRAGRPSLLSPDEQAATERQGILSSLDGMQAPPGRAPAARPRSRMFAWGGAAACALVVGAALFVAGAGDERQMPFAPPVTLAAASADVPRPAPVAAPAPVASAAAPAPEPALLRDEPAPAAANPLAEMAPPAPARHKVHEAKTRTKAEAKEARARRGEREAAHGKSNVQGKSKTRTAQQHPKARAVREADSDVLLLAALVSHMEPRKGKATQAEQLDACRRYNAAGEAQCRARVCEKPGPKDAACRKTRAEPES